MQVEIANKNNLGSLSYDDAFVDRNIAWASFLKPGLEPQQRRYEEISDWNKVQKLLKEYLDDYNSSHTNTMDLVFFQAAVDHVCRLCRVLQQVGSNHATPYYCACKLSSCKLQAAGLHHCDTCTPVRANMPGLSADHF